MFDNSVLNVVIGLVFIFLLYSLLATAIQEALANILQRRPNMLFYGIKSMLTNTTNNNNAPKIKLISHFLFESISSCLNYIKTFFVRKEITKLHEKFYNHPIIKNYGQNSIFSKPSYLSAQNFSTILIDTIYNLKTLDNTKSVDFNAIKEIIGDFEINGKYAIYAPKEVVDASKNTVTQVNLPAPEIEGEKSIQEGEAPKEEVKKAEFFKMLSAWLDQKVVPIFKVETIEATTTPPKIDAETLSILRFHLNESGGDLEVFRHRIEQWYNDSMERVTGWYKKNTHYWLFGIGMILALVLNINAIEISNYLSKNKVAADHLAKMGEAAVSRGTYSGKDSVIAQTALDSIKKDIQQVNTLVGLGWGDYGRSDSVFIKLLKEEKWHLPGKWYTLGLWFETVSLKEIYEKDIITGINNFRDSGNVYQNRLNTIKSKMDSLEKIALKSGNHDDSIANDKAKAEFLLASEKLASHNTQKGSFINAAFFDDVNAHYPIRLKKTYILSKIKLESFLGFLITAIAIGLGAPFWFDLLNKVVSLRSAGKVENTSASNPANAKDNTEG